MLSNGRAFPAFFILRIALILIVFSSVRALFFYFNSAVFSGFSGWQIAEAFLLGVRFDAWIVFVCLMPLFFLELSAFASRSELMRRVASVYSYFVLFLLSSMMFFELSDCEYYKFSGSRTTFAIFSVSTDALDQSFQLLRNFWHIPLLTLFYAFAFLGIWNITRMRGQSHAPHTSRTRVWLTTVAGVLVGTLAIRGGWQRKPLSPTHSVYLGDSNLSALALNTSFQMVHSVRMGSVKKFNFFPDDSVAGEKLKLPSDRHAPVNMSGSNLVILIVESLSSEYMGFQGISKNYAPFLSSLSEKSLYFENSFANGRQSIEAMPSILASLPSLIGEPFITSRYNNVPLPGLGNTLAAQGYSTAFFHGAKNGSMYIDAMAKKFGFEQFFGLSEYPDAGRDFDGSWGIFDEPFLKFTVQRISALEPPFAAGIFTLSSHNPYRIPNGIESRLPLGGTPFQRSLAYADYSVSQFFDAAQKQSWYNNTLFVLTGDHTAELNDEAFKAEQNIYRVPIIFFDPSGRLEVRKSNRLVQHADILPSVLDLLDIKPRQSSASFLPFGHSAFAPEAQARVANRSGGWFWYREGHSLVRLPYDEHLDAEIWEVDDTDIRRRKLKKASSAFDNQLIERAKAYLQHYNDGLIRGRF